METPVCVTDAQTFVDRIHEIKSWIYSGQLRLIVPSSLPENVEALYRKSVESKPATVKETPKQKPMGKTSRKEHPAFDANPNIAKEYLSRVEAGKNFETGKDGRPIYEDLEDHAAVHFALVKEQYSTWRDVDDLEEQADLPADHADTWADKLRRKQIKSNEIEENKEKGPARPKLVAKTGSDSSPWKVQKNAPTIAGTDVPAALRPMMSCTLWRIHESVHRNDENQVFVLTDQSAVKAVAEKLNITVQSSRQLHELLATLKAPVDLNTVGELEQEFGAMPVVERRPIRNTATRRSDLASKCVSIDGNAGMAATEEGQVMPIGRQRASGDDTVELPQHLGDLSKSNALGLSDRSPSQAELNTPDIPAPSGRSKINGTQTGGSHPPSSEQHRAEHSFNAWTRPLPVEKTNGHPKAGLAGNVALVDQEAASVKTVRESPGQKGMSGGEVSQTNSNVWSRSFADALSGNQVRKASPAPASASARPGSAKLDPRGNDTSTPILTRESNERDAPSKAPSRVDKAAQSPLPETEKGTKVLSNAKQSAGGPAQDVASSKEEPSTPVRMHDSSPDSDEEIVVFQPKRLSAQRRSVQQNSRPTTPNVQAQTPAVQGQARTTPQTPQATSIKKQVTPKQKHNSSKSGNGVAREQAPPKPNPPVIDPDAFGRDFAVNTNQNTKGSLRGPRPRHSPQPSLFDVATSRPNSSHHQLRKSPNKVLEKASPRQDTTSSTQVENSTPGTIRQRTPPSAAAKEITSNPQKQMPIGTGRPNPAPKHEDTPPQTLSAATRSPPRAAFSTPSSTPTLNANAPIFQPGGLAGSIFQSPLQRELTPPKHAPAVQPPIGSGRPSSKSAQEKTPEPGLSSAEKLLSVVQSEPVEPQEHAVQPPLGPRDRDSHPTRKPHGPAPAAALRGASHIGLAQRGGMAPQMNRRVRSANHVNSDFRPAIRGRGAGSLRGARVGRPSLFEPEMDRPASDQAQAVEAKRSAVPDVQYVLKSGATREEARGKGKTLWTG